MVDTKSAAGATPVDTMRRVAGSQAGLSIALGQMDDRLALLDTRLRALENMMADAETRHTSSQHRLTALSESVDAAHATMQERLDTFGGQAEARQLASLERLESLSATVDAGQTKADEQVKTLYNNFDAIHAKTHERLETLSAAIADNADMSREALVRLANKSAQDTEALSKAVETLGERQEKTFSGLIEALDAVAAEMAELGKVRDALQNEQRKTSAIQRRRLEDITRIQALSAERDALEIELQAAATRHRRALRSASPEAKPEPPALGAQAPKFAETSGSESETSAPVAIPSVPASLTDGAALLAEARRAKSARDWQGARDAYAAYLAVKPRKASAWKQYGHMLKENGQFEEAKVAYFRSLALSPSDVDTCLHLGHLLKNTGERDLAADIFRGALAMDPDFGAAKDGLGDLGFALPEPGPVRPKSQKAGTKLQRWLYGRRLRSAQKAFSARHWRSAEGQYRGLLQDRPWDARLMIQIGHALKEQGKVDEAAHMYQRAIDQEPLNSDAYLHLGHAAKLAGNIEGAHVHYRRALRYWPENPDALFELRDAS
ncbi:tetratricopeptide repeat protein [Brevundimonas sp. C43]|uniref:tetratricopeptide repeat protein n=1 Tax=Brevundimonas sp. C43 TaxID=3068314 RepID=UPI00273FC7FD|nr:tetratricopeptide repeat protein [Brevundimonas sp. C43]